MCLTLYLASDAALPLVAWDAARPGFHVVPLTTPDDDLVRPQFTKTHIVYAGSHQGCGCGFAYGQWEGEDADEAAAAQESVRALRRYLEAATAVSAPIELFVSWEGDQGLPPLKHVRATPADFDGPVFGFEDRTFAIITPAG